MCDTIGGWTGKAAVTRAHSVVAMRGAAETGYAMRPPAPDTMHPAAAEPMRAGDPMRAVDPMRTGEPVRVITRGSMEDMRPFRSPPPTPSQDNYMRHRPAALPPLLPPPTHICRPGYQGNVYPAPPSLRSSSGNLAPPSPVRTPTVTHLPVNQGPVNQGLVNQGPVNQGPVKQGPVNQTGGNQVGSQGPVSQGPVNQVPISQVNHVVIKQVPVKSAPSKPGPVRALHDIPILQYQPAR